jgi:peptidoglycan/LPS O-acetylase OafA/YrhL
MLPCAAGGILWYALEPEVASTQAASVLVLPAFISGIVWIGRRLPRWLDWVIAVALAAGGNLAYVLLDGSQWWLWGQFAVFPLVVLLIASGAGSVKPGQESPAPWYGGVQDGPWGPPPL